MRELCRPCRRGGGAGFREYRRRWTRYCGCGRRRRRWRNRGDGHPRRKRAGFSDDPVNNAGVSWRGTLDTYDPAQVTRMRQVNVEGVTNATRAVITGMRKRRYGRVVNVSSVAAIGTALPGNAFYAATKAEVAILTKRFAMELGPHNVTVNAVAPGFVRT